MVQEIDHTFQKFDLSRHQHKIVKPLIEMQCPDFEQRIYPYHLEFTRICRVLAGLLWHGFDDVGNQVIGTQSLGLPLKIEQDTMA